MVNDPCGLAPDGWHIPSDKEWKAIVTNLGGSKVAGKKMKSTFGWENNGNGTNISGFSGLPGGYRSDYGTFYNFGNYGLWWSSTEFDTGNAWGRFLFYGNGVVNRGYGNKADGLSVRCLRD